VHTRLDRGAVRLPTCTGTRRFAEAAAVQGEMCSQGGFNRELYLKRPRDAYAAPLLM
jgi:hypothetical protein